MPSLAGHSPLPNIRVPGVIRTPLRQLSLGRLLKGGRIDDAGRLPRYAGFFLLGSALIWAPITGYLATAPERHTSTMSLILPGAGASASVNLSEIGQASSYASSPYAHNSVSPTVTYKRLIGADRIVVHAAETMGLSPHDFGGPRVELVDQTGLIRVQVTGHSAGDAQAAATHCWPPSSPNSTRSAKTSCKPVKPAAKARLQNTATPSPPLAPKSRPCSGKPD